MKQNRLPSQNGRRKRSFRLCRDVFKCPNYDECTDDVSLWGETTEADGETLEWRPSPDMGGRKINDACVLVLGQNPNNSVKGEYNEKKFDYNAPPMEQLMWHREGLKHSFTPSQVVKGMGLDWDYVVWDNPVKCPTADNEITDTVFWNCVNTWLDNQILTLDPDFIVGMGAWSKKALNHIFDSLEAGFGDTKTTISGFKVHVMYHYSYLMRNGTFEASMEEFREEVLPEIPEVAHDS